LDVSEAGEWNLHDRATSSFPYQLGARDGNPAPLVWDSRANGPEIDAGRAGDGSGRLGIASEIGIAVLGASGVLLAVLGVRMARRWSRAVDQIEKSILALQEGRATQTLGAGPLDRLARTLNEAAPRLEAKVRQLERDRQQLGAVLEGMAEGVVAVDARRRLLFANPAAARLFGLDTESVGRYVAELIRTPQVQSVIEATIACSDRYRNEITVPGPDGWPRGQSLVLDVQGTPLPGSPSQGAVLVFHDVTDLRRLERMRQDFVANASHELKTPLASIKAYTETLLDGALHDENVNVAFLRRIEEQADRLDLLIRDLLSLARLESGEEVFRHDPMLVAPAFRRCVEVHRDRAEAKGLDYSLQVTAQAESALVTADEEAIRQILDNLLDNAIKYTPEGGRVRAALRVTDASEVVLEVQDSGIGIPRDEQPRVFERFYRVDKARSRELGGTGLGLSIVKHLVQSLQGRITLESRPGVGSTFLVYLPRSPGVAPSIGWARSSTR
jgi:two-component system, OmpR family, phosphate regulon sensor histidine kinase PhoR